MVVLGLDIGGANLKAATSNGDARSESFEIWRSPQDLPARLSQLIARYPGVDQIAVTMTAELADCYPTKAEGVASIVASVRQAAGPTPVRFWQTTGEFAGWQAAEMPRTIAAANWHALATWAGRLAPDGLALLIDIGSTTTDIIPLRDGTPVPRGTTDVERLMHHELVYTGFRRTPLCAVAPQVTVRGHPCAVAAELFATVLDVALLLGLTPPEETDCQTADGRPATIALAHDRIARMVCCDREEIDVAEARVIAQAFHDAQCRQLTMAIDSVIVRSDHPVHTVLVSGSGESLAWRLATRHPALCAARLVRLSQVFSPHLADAACAYAVAMLASERSG